MRDVAVYLTAVIREGGGEQNREESEIAQKGWEEGEKEKLGVGRIDLDGPG